VSGSIQKRLSDLEAKAGGGGPLTVADVKRFYREGAGHIADHLAFGGSATATLSPACQNFIGTVAEPNGTVAWHRGHDCLLNRFNTLTAGQPAKDFR